MGIYRSEYTNNGIWCESRMYSREYCDDDDELYNYCNGFMDTGNKFQCFL